MKDVRRWLYEALITPEERSRYEAQRERQREQQRRSRTRERLYADLAKKGVIAKEVDEAGRRLDEVMKRGRQ